MADITISGATREAVIMQIVTLVGYAEGKTASPQYPGFKGIDRAWLRETFAFARECIDGPAKQSMTMSDKDIAAI